MRILTCQISTQLVLADRSNSSHYAKLARALAQRTSESNILYEARSEADPINVTALAPNEINVGILGVTQCKRILLDMDIRLANPRVEPSRFVAFTYLDLKEILFHSSEFRFWVVGDNNEQLKALLRNAKWQLGMRDVSEAIFSPLAASLTCGRSLTQSFVSHYPEFLSILGL